MKTKIDLVTGFLGAGKTSFIQSYADWLRRQGEQSADGWAVPLLERAKAAGITDGTRPRSFATRQEAAAMVLAAQKLKDK